MSHVTEFLEQKAPLRLQESYDNAGLLVGNSKNTCTGVLVTLDITEDVIDEAIENKCNLIVAHHPIIFTGLKKLTGSNYVERTVIKAIKNDINLYATHTNLDNVQHGVNKKICDLIGLEKTAILSPKNGGLRKIATYVPQNHQEQVRNAMFEAGAGHIGEYDSCSFQTEGTGTFRANDGTNPFVGEIGKLHSENEVKIEMIFPIHLQTAVVKNLREAHPYEEVAFDIFELANKQSNVGSGMVGELSEQMAEPEFFDHLKSTMSLNKMKVTKFRNASVKRVAVCGGSGSFLLAAAKASGADVFITSDFKYHEFFDADGDIVIADIGHFESERFTIDLLYTWLTEKFPTFALLKSQVNTNPVNYL